MLAALLAQDTGGVTYEVIVVDNDSRDGTRAVVEEAMASDSSGLIQYVFEPRREFLTRAIPESNARAGRSSASWTMTAFQ